MAQGVVNKEWVSLVPFLDQRDIIPKLIDVTNEEASLVDIMEMLGNSYPTRESQFHNITNTELFAPGIVQSSSGAPGTTVTVVLTTATAQNCIDNSVAFLASGQRAYVKQNNAGTLTLVSVDGTNIIATDVQAGAAMTFPSVMFGEGSFGATAERWSKQTYTNVIQIFKQKYELTDIQLASDIEVAVNGQFNYMDVQRIESYLKFRKYISLGMIINKYSGDNFSSSSPTLTDLDGNSVNSTRGLDQYVTSEGINYPLASSTQWQLADIENIDAQLNAARAPKRYMVYTGTPMNQKLDNFLNALNNSSQLSQAGRFLISGDDLKLGIKSFSFYNRDYYKMVLPLMDDPNTLAYSGIGNISQSAYMVPLSQVKTVGGGSMPNLSLRYMRLGTGRDLRYMEQHTGGLVEPITTDQAIDAVNFYSAQGLQCLGTNFFVKVTPS